MYKIRRGNHAGEFEQDRQSLHIDQIWDYMQSDRSHALKYYKHFIAWDASEQSLFYAIWPCVDPDSVIESNIAGTKTDLEDILIAIEENS